MTSFNGSTWGQHDLDSESVECVWIKCMLTIQNKKYDLYRPGSNQPDPVPKQHCPLVYLQSTQDNLLARIICQNIVTSAKQFPGPDKHSDRWTVGQYLAKMNSIW